MMLEDVDALVFDVFGTVVDWRNGIIRDGELIHHGWDFDADKEEEAIGEKITHTFISRGGHDVTHTVVDDFDATDSKTKTVPILWEQVAKLVADDDEGDDRETFGYSVAEEDDTAIVAAPSDDDPSGVAGGSTYVFTRDGGRWSKQEKLAADAGDAGDRFGGLVGPRVDRSAHAAHLRWPRRTQQARTRSAQRHSLGWHREGRR